MERTRPRNDGDCRDMSRTDANGCKVVPSSCGFPKRMEVWCGTLKFLMTRLGPTLSNTSKADDTLRTIADQFTRQLIPWHIQRDEYRVAIYREPRKVLRRYRAQINAEHTIPILALCPSSWEPGQDDDEDKARFWSVRRVFCLQEHHICRLCGVGFLVSADGIEYRPEDGENHRRYTHRHEGRSLHSLCCRRCLPKLREALHETERHIDGLPGLKLAGGGVMRLAHVSLGGFTQILAHPNPS